MGMVTCTYVGRHPLCFKHQVDSPAQLAPLALPLAYADPCRTRMRQPEHAVGSCRPIIGPGVSRASPHAVRTWRVTCFDSVDLDAPGDT
jgi:hypothetical protein